MNGYSNQQLNRALSLAQAGQLDEARNLVIELIHTDSNNAEAWFMLARITDSIQERNQALQNVLRLNPYHQGAQAMQQGTWQEPGIASPYSAYSPPQPASQAPPSPSAYPPVAPRPQPPYHPQSSYQAPYDMQHHISSSPANSASPSRGMSLWLLAVFPLSGLFCLGGGAVVAITAESVILPAILLVVCISIGIALAFSLSGVFRVFPPGVLSSISPTLLNLSVGLLAVELVITSAVCVYAISQELNGKPELSQTYKGDFYEFRYPEGWYVIPDWQVYDIVNTTRLHDAIAGDPEYTRMEKGEIHIILYYESSKKYWSDPEGSYTLTMDEALDGFADSVDTSRHTDTTIKIINGKKIGYLKAYSPQWNPDLAGLLVVIEIDNRYWVLSGWTLHGELDEAEDIILEIAGSLNVY